MVGVYILLVSGVLLAGCASPQDILIENKNLPTTDKISLIGGEENINIISPSNDKCVTLVECAFYIHDYELARWLLEKSKKNESYYVDYGDGHKIRYVTLSAIESSRSDEEAKRNIELLYDYGYQINACGYGYISPMNYAYRKGYVKTFNYMLSTLEHDKNGMVDVDSFIQCELPYDLKKNDIRNYNWRYGLGARHYAIKDFEGKSSQIEMFKALMDVSNNILNANNMGWVHNDLCAEESQGILLYVAECEHKTAMVKMIEKYILDSNRLTKEQKISFFDKLANVKNKARKDRIDNAIAEEKYRAYINKLRSEDAVRPSPAMQVFSQSIEEQLGLKSSAKTRSPIINNSKSNNKSLNGKESAAYQTGFHLTKEDIAPAPEPYDPETYCRKHSEQPSCKKEVAPPSTPTRISQPIQPTRKGSVHIE